MHLTSPFMVVPVGVSHDVTAHRSPKMITYFSDVPTPREPAGYSRIRIFRNDEIEINVAR